MLLYRTWTIENRPDIPSGTIYVFPSVGFDLDGKDKFSFVIFSHPGEFKRDLDEYLSYGVITRDN